MNVMQLKEKLQATTYDRIFTVLYGAENVAMQKERYLALADAFADLYGTEVPVTVFSVPGRTEVSGNHTDHNFGKVIAGAVDLDIVAMATPTDRPIIRMESQGFSSDTVDITDLTVDESKFFTSASIITGTCEAFTRRGLKIGGFDCVAVSNVFKGSGLSSSAAYEVMIGNILNHFYNNGIVDEPELAKIGQYAENVFFGKPCGLMDQTACAVGSFVAIDFADPKNPIIEKLGFDLTAVGYSLCIVNTGGNHADLNDDYASVPEEMKAVAKELGHEVLRQATYEELIAAIPALREKVGDRAILRAIHFLGENPRVEAQTNALKAGDLASFLAGVTASGASSYKRLQNVYTVKNVEEQGLSLAITLAENFIAEKNLLAACRVHGGGFAGTIQAFLPNAAVAEFNALMDSVFGEGASHVLKIRPYGAICVDKLV